MGNYKSAHHTLVEACRILQEKKLRISSDLRRTLMLLHSYIIVKDLIKYMHDEQTACRMLLRVVRNIQKFQLHMSTIITSTVLQCVKAQFKKSAFEYARLLIQNEKLRTQLNEKNRKKIESVVRRYVKDEDVDPVEISTPCPFCDAPVPQTELDCGACKNAIPFCIVTGKHIVKTDFTISPCCKFPAVYSAFIARVKNMPTCPLCDAPLDANKILKVKDPDLKELM